MNILPSVKTQYSRIPSFYNPNGFVKSKRKTVFYGDANLVSGNNFHLNRARRLVLLRCSYSESGSITQPGLENMPLSMDLEPISGESQFDQVLTEAQQLQESVIVLWMASWCRKCIYLKPKLEKLAADYYPRVRFYCVDVNNVPHRLVVRAGVTKMPTIQLWRDGKKEAEVIGGHKAYLVVSEIRDIIENDDTL